MFASSSKPTPVNFDAVLGLTRGKVALKPHSEKWHALFANERDLLQSVLPADVVIEHIGSTAICCIAAKPILDIMIGISPFSRKMPFVSAIEALGYEYKGENGVAGRHFFGKGVPRTVHLNVVEYGGEFWDSHVAFRDFLKSHRNAALEYDELKRLLAAKFANDRESYTNGKIEFVERILSLSQT